MELDKRTEQILISAIRESSTWKRLPVSKKDRPAIKDEGAKRKIKCSYPGAKLNEWKKEYAKYRHFSGFIVEIHRFYNTRNHKEEYDRKIKRPQDPELIKELIAIVEQDLGTQVISEAREQAAPAKSD